MKASARTKARSSSATPAATAGPAVAAEPAAPNPTGVPPASVEAKRLAAAILEVLAGARGPSEAAQMLGISLARYYQLENRAIAGLVIACEPRRRGRGSTGPSELASLRQECQRLRRDCARQQALVRAAQRTVGLNTPAVSEPPAPTGGSRKKRRKRRPTARALKMAAMLQAADVGTPAGEDPPAAATARAAPEGVTVP